MTKENLQCPFCQDFIGINDEDAKALFKQHILDRYKGTHGLEVAHNGYAIISKVVELLSEQQKMIPVSKIEAKIEELRKILRDNAATIPYDRQWIVVSVAIPALEDLLPNKEKEKPEGGKQDMSDQCYFQIVIGLVNSCPTHKQEKEKLE